MEWVKIVPQCLKPPYYETKSLLRWSLSSIKDSNDQNAAWSFPDICRTSSGQVLRFVVHRSAQSVHPSLAACVAQIRTCYKHSPTCAHLLQQLHQEASSQHGVFWSQNIAPFASFSRFSCQGSICKIVKVIILHIILKSTFLNNWEI